LVAQVTTGPILASAAAFYVLRVIRSCGVYEEPGISHAVAGNRMR
jgi:hypothetical protein